MSRSLQCKEYRTSNALLFIKERTKRLSSGRKLKGAFNYYCALSLFPFNPIRAALCQINARQSKMTTILERLSALVPHFVTFSFKVLCTILKKLSLAVLCLCRCADVDPGPYPQLKIKDIGFAAIRS